MRKLKYQNNINGLTFLEIIVTAAILGIIAAVVIPVVYKFKGSGRQAVCMNNLRQISHGLQMYYDDKKLFPEDGYPYDDNDLLPLSTELAEYVGTKQTFVCPEDKDQVSAGNFASYDPFYVKRGISYQERELIIGCPRHRGAEKSISLFHAGFTNTMAVGAVLANGQEIPPDGNTEQRTISNINDELSFADGSTVTITQPQLNYGVFLVQSAQLTDGTLYSIIRVQDNGTIDVQVSTGSKFEIITPSAIVGVRGTQFTITTSNNGYTTGISLVNGTLTVSNRETVKEIVLSEGGITDATISTTNTTNTTAIVTICHKPGTPQEKTKIIPQSDLQGHLGHGDSIGACP